MSTIYKMHAQDLLEIDGQPFIIMWGMANTYYLAPLVAQDVTATLIDPAAPELLTVLERVSETMDIVDVDEDWHEVNIPTAVVNEMRAAIAKARGETWEN